MEIKTKKNKKLDKIVEYFVKNNVLEHDISFEINILNEFETMCSFENKLKNKSETKFSFENKLRNESENKFGFEITLKKRICNLLQLCK